MGQQTKASPVRHITSDLRAEKVVRYGLIIYAVLYGIVCGVLLLNYTAQKGLWMIGLVCPLLFAVPLYFFRLFPMLRTKKWLAKYAMDICEVATWDNAIVSPSDCAIIPFSLISRVQFVTPETDDFYPEKPYLKVRCVDGKSFTIHSDADTWYLKYQNADHA